MKNKILAFFICFFIGVTGVLATASHDLNPGDDGSSHSCGSDYCYNVAVGFRMTIVNTDTGARCKYDSSSKKICTSSGTNTQSIDVWLSKGGTRLGFLYDNTCKSYTTRRTKKEYLAAGRTGTLKRCGNDYGTVYDLADIGLSRIDGAVPTVVKSRVTDVIVNQMNAKNYSTINNMLSKMIGSNVNILDIDRSSLQKAAVELEQILLYYGANNGNYIYGYYGTVAEVTTLFSQHQSQVWCVNANGAVPNEMGCSDYMQSGGYITGWSGSKTLGSLTAASTPPARDASSFSPFWQSNTVNVGHIIISDFLPSCEDEAKTIYDSYFGRGEAAYEAALLANSTIADECGSNLNNCFSLKYQNAKVLGKSSLTCSTLTCNEYVTKAYATSKPNSVLKPYFENFLFAKYRNNFLKEDFYTQFGRTKASCSTPPTCDFLDDVNGNCGNAIYFKDGAYAPGQDQNRCWKVGYAYSTADGDVLQSSFDEAVSGHAGCNIYCSHNVSFNLPDASNTKTKAGKLFKWGINDDEELFGTMTVEKTCMVNAVDDGSCEGVSNYYYSDNWTSKVRSATRLKINYSEPTQPSLYNYVDEPLTITNSSSTPYYMRIYGTSGYNNSTNRFSCHNQYCTNISRFVVRQVFDIKYGDAFKWYSYKENNNLVNEIDPSKEAAYYEIGYGIPTAFSTPQGTYNDKLSAKIENVGQNGHFAKLIKKETGKDYIEYSCQFEVENELYQHECYDEDGNLLPDAPDYCFDNEVKDIDVVFRTITLLNNDSVDSRGKVNKAFPGRAGTSRALGRNWWGGLKDRNGNLLTSDDARYDRIVQILDGDVYQNNKPQYIIRLDAGAIREIRKQNKAVKNDNYAKNKDPYSNFEIINDDSVTPGYKGYYCYEENGRKYCSSRFLTYLADKNILWGYCLSQSGAQGSYERTTTRAKNIAKGRYCLQS